MTMERALLVMMFGSRAIKRNLEGIILARSHEFQLTEGFHVILLVALSDCVQVGGRLVAFESATSR